MALNEDNFAFCSCYEGVDLPELMPASAGLKMDTFVSDIELAIGHFSMGDKLQQLGSLLFAWDCSVFDESAFRRDFVFLQDPLEVFEVIARDAFEEAGDGYLFVTDKENFRVALEGFYLACDAVEASIRMLHEVVAASETTALSSDQLQQLFVAFQLYYETWCEVFAVAKMIAVRSGNYPLGNNCPKEI